MAAELYQLMNFHDWTGKMGTGAVMGLAKDGKGNEGEMVWDGRGAGMGGLSLLRCFAGLGGHFGVGWW
jgi:hypothetical protein